ncbi:MAG: hypothetical protein ACYTEI_00505 [Planctomycetota bacterium]|jgi:hypothetical protein
MLKRVADFLRWLFSSERLPEAAPPEARERGVVAMLAASDTLDVAAADRPRRQGPGFLSAVLATDTLPQRDAPARDVAARTGFLRRLLAPDTLPQRDAPARDVAARTGFLRRLLAPETLPQRDAPARDAAPPTGFLNGLLSPQELPRAEPLPRPRGRGFMRWLLSRDEL